MAAWFQSILAWNGRTHEFDNRTGIQPACSASKNLLSIQVKVNHVKSFERTYLNEPRRRPLGTKQKVEFCKSVS